MRDRNKNKRIKFPDFFNYLSDKRTGEERNAFERELQKDPFARDAAEGFDSLEPKKALADISDLEKRLKKRVDNSQRIIFYRVAASLAVLLAISSLLIFIERNRSEKEIAVVTDQPGSIEITQSLPVTVQSDKKEFSEQAARSQERKSGQTANPQSGIQPEPAGKETKSADYEYIDSADKVKVEVEAKTMNEPLRYEKAAAAVSAPSKAKKSPGFQVEGKVISAEDDMPVPGVSIVIKGTHSGVVTDRDGNFKIALPDSDNQTLVASFIGMETKEIEVSPDTPANIRLNPSLASLSEIVVTGYGVGKSESELENNPEAYLPPQPDGGKSAFNKYIRENLVRPDTVITGTKAVVVLNFIVHTDGSIDSIMILKSPGKLFSDAAIRLLKEGPSWIPANEDGRAVEDIVRLRIVFK